MRKVQELIAAVTRDNTALHSLRFDPAALARSMNLGLHQLQALDSAGRFFDTEKPILDSPVPFAPAPPSRVVLSVGIKPLGGTLVASADTGSLYTGPTTGTYTISSSAHEAVVRGPGAPSAPAGPAIPAGPSLPAGPSAPTAPAGPLPPTVPVSPLPPVIPAGPTVPIVPVAPSPASPAAPLVPGIPSAPLFPCPPAVPACLVPPGSPTAPWPAVPQPVPAVSGHSCCNAAITAMVADVSATANTAMVALTALARPHQRTPKRVTS